MTALTVTLH